MTIHHEYNRSAWHRLVAVMSDGKVHQSEYAPHQGIAVLTIRDNTYMAVTSYHQGSISIKPNTVYQVTEVK
jgi:hypothetical protein